ncbi:MAG: hypothetical protein DWI22_02455 [Planctomycetota bacterium]|nr:MAG: hypothetical protein DWI22_02455 [Planctomycetota bacterium]
MTWAAERHASGERVATWSMANTTSRNTWIGRSPLARFSPSAIAKSVRIAFNWTEPNPADGLSASNVAPSFSVATA